MLSDSYRDERIQTVSVYILAGAHVELTVIEKILKPDLLGFESPFANLEGGNPGSPPVWGREFSGPERFTLVSSDTR